MQAGKIVGKYPSEVRQFALTISFFSSAAYQQLKLQLQEDLELPHLSTIRKWYQNVDGGPGITSQSLDFIKQKIRESEKELLFCLMMDEMSIRTMERWKDGKKEQIGFVDFGGINVQLKEGREEKLTTQAYVFLLNCLNSRLKVPIAYFFVNSLDSKERANITSFIITSIYESTGAKIVSTTFDGPKGNLCMCELLGANTYPDINSSIKVDGVPYSINVSLDNCHMLKIIRNNFKHKKILYYKNERIEWKYLEELLNIQTEEELAVAPKITFNHINFEQQKMKVRLATQLFSISVANGLLYLEKTNPKFKGSLATSQFLRMFNDLFDIFNSSTLYDAYSYKRGISINNLNYLLKKLSEGEDYIHNLYYYDFKHEQKLKILSRTCLFNTGFRGFLINICTFRNLVTDYLLTKQIEYILFYKISQDHLELFFSLIRQRGGHNDNPDCTQFISAYKMLVVNKIIKHIDTGNCISQDTTGIVICIILFL